MSYIDLNVSTQSQIQTWLSTCTDADIAACVGNNTWGSLVPGGKTDRIQNACCLIVANATQTRLNTYVANASDANVLVLLNGVTGWNLPASAALRAAVVAAMYAATMTATRWAGLTSGEMLAWCQANNTSTIDTLLAAVVAAGNANVIYNTKRAINTAAWGQG